MMPAAKVYLVGAGPGDAELLTIKARRLLQRADYVLHDDLVSQEVLVLAAPSAFLLNVGKRCGRKAITQEQINEMLISLARGGAFTVRLKSGDPSLFARSAEEIDALEAAGLEVEVVPGVTAALAAAASARVSLTRRELASTVIFTTGHLCGEGDAEHWKRLAGPRRTLAIYMPGPNLRALAHELLRAGFLPETPCLLVSAASRSGEQKVRASLRIIGEYAPLPAPSVFFLGEVFAEQRETLSGNASVAAVTPKPAVVAREA